MVTRTSRTAGMVMTGTQWGKDLKRELKALFDGLDEIALMRLINVSGANYITAETDPVMTAYSGGPFILKAVQNNTGSMTLKIGSLATLPLKGRRGELLKAGQVKANDTFIVIHDKNDNEFRIINGLSSAGAPITKFYKYPGAYTWTKPDGLLYIEVEVIGGGSGTSSGGGGLYSGGNSGAYAKAIIPADELSSHNFYVGSGSNGEASGNASQGTASYFGGFVYAAGGPASYYNGSEYKTPATFSGTHVTVGVQGGLYSGSRPDYIVGVASPVYGVRKVQKQRALDGGDGSYGNGGAFPADEAPKFGNGDHGVVIITEYY